VYGSPWVRTQAVLLKYLSKNTSKESRCSSIWRMILKTIWDPGFVFICTVYQCYKDRYTTNPKLYTIRCLLEIKHDTHKLRTIFNVLQIWYLSYLQHVTVQLCCTQCDVTTVLYTTWRHTQFGVMSQFFSIGAGSLLGFRFTVRPFISLPIE
jgi:hypothetical protein